MKKLLVLRISLVLAITGLLAVLAMAHLVLRPKIETLSGERDSFRNASEQNLTRAIKAETQAQQLSQELEQAAAQAKAAVRETERITTENGRILIDLEKTRAALHSTKQDLARWNTTGTNSRSGIVSGP